MASLLMATAVMGQANYFHANIQNAAVTQFLGEVTYTNAEDSSRVSDFIANAEERLDVPLPAVVEVPAIYTSFIGRGNVTVSYSYDEAFSDDATHTLTVVRNTAGAAIYDLQPGVDCFYRTFVRGIKVGWGTVTTEGPVRMLNLPSVRNVRDLGGWTTADGRTVKYGKLIRGGELNGMHVADAADIQHLRDVGVAAEIDLRAFYEEDNGVSAFGFKNAAAAAGDVPSYLFTSDSGQLPSHLTTYGYLQRWRNEFNFIVQNLRIGRTVYFHCRWGADRTGYLALLLEGLLGVPYDGLIKDYELTSFANNNKRKENIDPVIAFIEKLDGETLQQKFNTFWTKRAGVKQADIDYFIDEMLDGEKPGSNVDTSIATVEQAPAVMTYDLQGHRVTSHYHGLTLQRQQDGSVRKTMR